MPQNSDAQDSLKELENRYATLLFSRIFSSRVFHFSEEKISLYNLVNSCCVDDRNDQKNTV